MTDVETQVRAALAKLGAANGATETPQHNATASEATPRRGPVWQHAKTRVKEIVATGGAGWDRIAAKCGSDVGKFADLEWDGVTLAVRIGSISGMTGKATVQVCDTRQVMTVPAVDLINRREVE